MIANRLRVLVLVVPLALWFGACDSPTGTGGPPILIPNVWTNVNDADHRLDLRSPDEATTSGVFSGREDHGTLDQFDSPIGGHWSNGRVVMTIVRGSRTPKFVATFSTPMPTILEFIADPSNAPQDGSFTIQQN